MPKSSNEIMLQFGNALTGDIKKAIPSATGRTADSVNIEYLKNNGKITGFVIRGGSQIGAIIDGRKPSKQGKVPGELKGTILEWIASKSIRPREANMSVETLAFLITRSIHKKGYKGKGNIFAEVITKQRFQSLTRTLIKAETLSLQSSLIKEINFE